MNEAEQAEKNSVERTPEVGWCEWNVVFADYRARLRGEWPLDAPPLEVP